MNIDNVFNEILDQITEKEDVKKFLKIFEEIHTDCMGSHFDYTIIELKDIPNIIFNADMVTKNFGSIDIQISSNTYSDEYNPIIYWIFDCEILNIYDWINIKRSLIRYDWGLEDKDKQKIIDEFNKTIEEQCYELLDKLNETEISQIEMEKICQIFPEVKELFDEEPFHTTPKYINNLKELSKHLIFYIDEKPEDYILKGLFFGKKYHEELKDIAKNNNGYWFYRDGVNWEAFIVSQTAMIGYIKQSISFVDPEIQEEILKTIKCMMLDRS